ncbi:MAG: hypothetical protein ABR616_15770 [Dermatophilaceae bacterium]|nr:hypothetical protein [Intrasporangiaceae bacterium]
MKRKTNPRIERIRTQERAKERLKKKGLKQPPRPEGDQIEVPLELADLSDADLMEELREHTEWTNHLGAELVNAEITEETAQTIFERMKTAKMLGMEPSYKGETMTERKARAGLSDEVQEAEDEFLAAKAYRKLVLNLYESAERKASNISREITRRVGRDGPDRRSMRWNP